jgi:hypothetical protein
MKYMGFVYRDLSVRLHPGQRAAVRAGRWLLVGALAGVFIVAVATLAAAGSSSVGRAEVGRSGGAASCISMATCYTARQLEVAYGVEPLLRRGIDGRGETVVLPELAESQLAPPLVSDLRQDFVVFDRLFGLPAPRLRFVSTFAGPREPWLAYGEEVLDAELVHTIAPRAALTILLVRGTSLDSAAQAVAASVAALRLGASEGGIISLSPAGQIGGEHCVSNAQLSQLNAALQTDADQHVSASRSGGPASLRVARERMGQPALQGARRQTVRVSANEAAGRTRGGPAGPSPPGRGFTEAAARSLGQREGSGSKLADAETLDRLRVGEGELKAVEDASPITQPWVPDASTPGN